MAPDVTEIVARVTFDCAEQVATATATVQFTMQETTGHPVLDLRQDIDAVSLDGRELGPEALVRVDLGGGEDAEMLALSEELETGSSHVLTIGYRLSTPRTNGAQPVGWAEGGVRWDFWMSDLYPGRYLESWIPAPLCHDRFALTVELVVAHPDEHLPVVNGRLTSLGANHWRVEYPEYYTSLSPMLVLAPAAEVEQLHRDFFMAGREMQLHVYRHREVVADLTAVADDTVGWLTHNAVRYPPWAHGTSFTAFVWGPGRGMEYDGATTAAIGAMEHEVFHSWFGRGVKLARSKDGWIDEAYTSWSTSSRRSELPRFLEEELPLDQPPVTLCPASPWSRYTPLPSYREGARLFAGIADRLGGADILRSAMATWYAANVGELITTEGLLASLEATTGVGLSDLFARYVYGRD